MAEKQRDKLDTIKRANLSFLRTARLFHFHSRYITSLPLLYISGQETIQLRTESPQNDLDHAAGRIPF